MCLPRGMPDACGYLLQDLERARLIVDITRKREKIKRDYVRVNNAMLRIGMEDSIVVRVSLRIVKGGPHEPH